MKRPNREVEIFSLSALDLFASAMGAFIVLVMIMFPYYLKTEDREQEVAELEQRATRARKAFEAANAGKEVEELREARIKMEKTEQQLLAEQEKEEQQAGSRVVRSVEFGILGLYSEAKSFVILIDLSGSMIQYGDLMVETVTRLLGPLDQRNSVAIIGYKSAGYSAGAPATYQYWPRRGRTEALTPEQKRSAEGFAHGLTRHFGGGTPTRDALIEALDYRADAILLLSDGAPAGSAQAIIEEVTRKNRGRKEIHAVALGEYVGGPSWTSMVDFMIGLAQKNKGNFVGVSKSGVRPGGRP